MQGKYPLHCSIASALGLEFVQRAEVGWDTPSDNQWEG